MAMTTAMVADRTRMRILLLSRRSSVFNIFGVEGEARGVSHETFSLAPAHVRSHGDDQNDQNDQSSEPVNKPRERFILEESLSL